MIHALKYPFAGTISRPNSRPSSPAPPPVTDIDTRLSRPTNRLSLTSFRKPSPSPAGMPQLVGPTPIVQDGAYLNTLSLKLSEAVAKALAQPAASGLGPTGEQTLAGRRLLPPGRGTTLGLLITSEINAAKEHPYLMRAIVRSLHRPLSVLMTNLSAHLLPLLNSPAFVTPAQVSAHTLNPTQTHALAYATLAGELLEALHDLGLGTATDGLLPVKDGLENLATRVVHPLISAVRKDLSSLMESLEFCTGPNGSPKFGASGSVKSQTHASIITLQNNMPLYARALTRYTAPFPCVGQIQGALTASLIGVSWRGLVALSHRKHPQGSPVLAPKNPSPAGSPTSSPAIKKKQLAAFSISRPGTRPPSPATRSVSSSAITGDEAKVVHNLLSTLPRSRTSVEAEEAVDAALRGLAALSALLLVSTSCPALDELEKLTEDIPTLVCLPVVMHAYVPTFTRSVADMMGMTEDEYRQTCLVGFSRADDCASVVGLQVLKSFGETDEGDARVFRDWLEDEVNDANE